MDTHTDVIAVAAGLKRVVEASPHTNPQIAELAGISYEKLLKQLDGGARIDVVDFRRIARALGMTASDLMREVEALQVAA